jgi:hypothetical protein
MELRHLAWDVDTQKAWKSHPIRVIGPRVSTCCGAPTLVVQGMQGGFVNANCSKPGCNKKATLSRDEFEALSLWVSCPECRGRMVAGMVDKNYAYTCADCGVYVRLADLLPYWSDIERR